MPMCYCCHQYLLPADKIGYVIRKYWTVYSTISARSSLAALAHTT